MPLVGGGPTAADDDFDSEKTMVVEHDPDEAPTADYDPRNVGTYDPRARGVYSAPMPAVIPAAPAAPRFDAAVLGTSSSGDDEEAPATVQVPSQGTRGGKGSVPEARPSEGRRRTSRRTVRIPDDPVRRRELDQATRRSQTEEAPPAEAGAAPTTTIDDLDFSDEITIVKPLRIISVGDDAPARSFSSPHATWPPSARSGVRLGDDASPSNALGQAQLLNAPQVEPVAPTTVEVEPGWTPAAPPVAAAPEALGSSVVSSSSDAQAAPPRAQAAPPAAPDSTEEAPSISTELVEEIELESHADDVEVEVVPEPKRAPPPPPKRKGDAPKTPPPGEVGRKGRPWWEEVFSDEYIRTMDQLEPKIAKREVDFIEESLGLEQHAVVLDLACGMGEITNELATRGYGVVGLDLSSGMLARAQAGAKARQRADAEYRPPTYVQADMRELGFEEEFDGIYCWSTSFGYFDEETNAALLVQLNRALRQGGLLLIDVVNRDYVAPRTPSLVWFEGDAAVCMDDAHVDFFTSRMRIKRTAMFEGGSSRELEYSIRLYTLHELGKLLRDAGFKVLEVTGHPAHRGVFFGAESPRMIVLAEKVG